MKKIIFVFLLSFISLPVFAVCSITGGACAAPLNFEANTLRDKLVPNNLQKLQRTDSFQPQIVTPYGTNVHTTNQPEKFSPESSDYDANCQFGTCLPENK